MENIGLRLATVRDELFVISMFADVDYDSGSRFSRAEKITKAIAREECFLIVADNREVGFLLFDYRFFDRGWIELIIIDEKYRGKRIGVRAMELICQQCKTDKVFTSTNTSNMPMQRALAKAGFTFAGEVDGLDEGDPELFYYKKIKPHTR
jgi:RimJ/RimL family protein N-acetyltransferase